MKKVITFSALFLYSIFGYSDNNLNQQTGMYYITANNFFYRPSTERGNEVVDRQNASEFSDRISGSAINITDSLVFDAYTSSTSLIAQGSMGDLKDTKFYTQETKLVKKLWNDKLEIYGGTVLGANPYQLNNMNSAYDPGSRIAAFASGRTGAKYNVSRNFGLLIEGQYNLTGEMADNTDMFTGFNGAQYRNSTLVKTGFEWNF
ncbi:hypothetical protein [Francisella tularensis]|uniref:hypothetical protein n=1 Tax=Francisella tularensis TaxID=263 RepID=UPI000158B280|nr:hypothetical protein [Francisella tularensis]AJI72579.1 hypothetical protein AQ14_1076 [Francisella tularensis subsp. novicida D9876]AVC43656.1 hypothetical protein B4919_02055 [Francisella tularensis subsp. novicida]EDN38331.1 conserved hypothetical protein [Francisella tularensis subsp. novicida GA99-3548]EDZ90119.1 hypothetical protein FTG_0310 [Francisella tularensis subsp. novicida FTG]MBK2109882.1 hypothetical protein [Francisella tularensis subsp. novicida FSC595]